MNLAQYIDLRSELDSIALVTVIAGSICNAHQRNAPCRIQPQAIPAYLPNGTELSSAIAALDSTDSALSGALCALRNQLRLLKTFGSTVIAAAETNGDLDIAPIADATRRAGSLCFVVRNVLQRSIDRIHPENASSTRSPFDDFLKDITSGGTPCLDKEGNLTIPGFADRRSVLRHRMHVPVRIHHGGRSSEATIVDCSSFGIGLADTSGIELNERVSVQLPSGVRVSGTAIWVSGNRAGLQTEALDTGVLRLLRNYDTSTTGAAS